MPYSITINAVEYRDYADLGTIRPVSSLKDRSDNLQDLILTIGVVAGTPEVAIPQAKREVIVTDDGGTKIFAGVVERVREELVENHPVQDQQIFQYILKCSDYGGWFDRRLIAQEYPKQATDVTVKSMIDNFVNTEGDNDFTYNNVAAGMLVAEKDYHYVAASRIMDELADETGYVWWIDEDRDVHFQLSTTTQAPMATINFEENTDVQDLIMEEIGDQITNRVYLLNARPIAVGADGNSRIINKEKIGEGDGTARFWPMLYEPGSTASVIAQVGGSTTTYTFAGGNMVLDYQNEGPDNHHEDSGYLCIDNRGFAVGSAPTAGTPIFITTDYVHESMTLMTQDLESQSIIGAKEDTSGVYEDSISAADMVGVSEDTVRARGDILILQTRLPKFVGVFNIYENGWLPGQTFQGTSDRRLGGFDSTQFFVLGTEKQLIHAEETDSYVVLTTVYFADDVWGE